MKQFFYKLLCHFVRWLDPKLNRFRAKKPDYAPRSIEEFIKIMRRTPLSIITKEQRNIIAAVMSYRDRQVKDLMLPKDQTTFVRDTDYLGPLMLDKLYQSGSEHFPVVDRQDHIVGLLHTASLNSLEIRKTDRASKYLDPEVFYLRSDYSLPQALAAFLRTKSLLFVVVDKEEHPVGILTYKMFLEYLFGELPPTDDFGQDADSQAVATRQI